MDVNVERAEDVLTHKRLLELAKDPAQRPAFAVRAVQVSCSPLLMQSLLETVDDSEFACARLYYYTYGLTCALIILSGWSRRVGGSVSAIGVLFLYSSPSIPSALKKLG
jgi:hypothetical protein